MDLLCVHLAAIHVNCPYEVKKYQQQVQVHPSARFRAGVRGSSRVPAEVGVRHWLFWQHLQGGAGVIKLCCSISEAGTRLN